MANKKILTQSELHVLNDSLEQLAANLKLHVNGSISVAHGLNAKVANYYDDRGDQWGSIVLSFEFGTAPDITRIYVPAQITTIGPGSESSGLVPTGSASGSFSSPGIPIGGKTLVTELAEESLGQSTIYNNILLAHASTVHSDTGAGQCHGGTSYVTGSVTDTLDHVVSRKYVILGINGTAWKIPGDEFVDGSSYGPPQYIRGVNLLASVSKVHNRADMAQDDKQQGVFYLTPATGGTLPYTVEFQLNNSLDGSSSSWTPMTVQFGSGVTGYTKINPAGKAISYDVSSTLKDRILIQTTEGHDDDVQLECTIRAKITNAAGIVYTNWCRFYAADKDGNCFLGLITMGIISGAPDRNSITRYEKIAGSPAIVT